MVGHSHRCTSHAGHFPGRFLFADLYRKRCNDSSRIVHHASNRAQRHACEIFLGFETSCALSDRGRHGDYDDICDGQLVTITVGDTVTMTTFCDWESVLGLRAVPLTYKPGAYMAY